MKKFLSILTILLLCTYNICTAESLILGNVTVPAGTSEINIIAYAKYGRWLVNGFTYRWGELTQTTVQEAIYCRGCGKLLYDAKTNEGYALHTEASPLTIASGIAIKNELSYNDKRGAYKLGETVVGGFQAFQVVPILHDYVSQYISRRNWVYYAGTSHNCSCGQTTYFSEYTYESPEYNYYVYGARAQPYYGTGIDGSVSSLQYSGCTFAGSAPGMYSGTIPVYFYNCTFKAPITSIGSKVTLNNCTGVLNTLNDNIDMAANKLTLPRWANYNGTKYSPQTLINENKVVTLTGAAASAAAKYDTLNIPNGSGVAWQSNYKEVTPESPTLSGTYYLRVPSLSNYTNFVGTSGEVQVSNWYENDLHLCNASAKFQLHTSENLYVENSALNDSNLQATKSVMMTNVVPAGSATINADIIEAQITPSAASGSWTLAANNINLHKFNTPNLNLTLNLRREPIMLKASSLGSLTLNDTGATREAASLLEQLTIKSPSTINTTNSVTIKSSVSNSRLMGTGSGEVIIDGGTSFHTDSNFFMEVQRL